MVQLPQTSSWETSWLVQTWALPNGSCCCWCSWSSHPWGCPSACPPSGPTRSSWCSWLEKQKLPSSTGSHWQPWGPTSSSSPPPSPSYLSSAGSWAWTGTGQGLYWLEVKEEWSCGGMRPGGGMGPWAFIQGKLSSSFLKFIVKSYCLICCLLFNKTFCLCCNDSINVFSHVLTYGKRSFINFTTFHILLTQHCKW